jgi:hypothetical protein
MILIPDMKMPFNCFECYLHRDGLCKITGENAIAGYIDRPGWCPLLEISSTDIVCNNGNTIMNFGGSTMVPTETKNLHWKDAWFHLLNGKKIKRPLWEGYWAWENNTIMMHCRDGSISDIRETENPAYTFTNVAARDWMVVNE